jgi:hypothetical protein
MPKPDTIIVDGHAFSWQRLCELRRQQLDAFKAAQPSQAALFELKTDLRPEPERTASGRYREPDVGRTSATNSSLRNRVFLITTGAYPGIPFNTSTPHASTGPKSWRISPDSVCAELHTPASKGSPVQKSRRPSKP